MSSVEAHARRAVEEKIVGLSKAGVAGGLRLSWKSCRNQQVTPFNSSLGVDGGGIFCRIFYEWDPWGHISPPFLCD